MLMAAVFVPDLLREAAIGWTVLVAVAILALYENCRRDPLVCVAFVLLTTSRLGVLVALMGGPVEWYGSPMTFVVDAVLTVYAVRAWRRWLAVRQ